MTPDMEEPSAPSSNLNEKGLIADATSMERKGVSPPPAPSSNLNGKGLIADATSIQRKGVSPPPSVLYATAYDKTPEMIAEDVFRKKMISKITKNDTLRPKCLWCNGELLAYRLSAETWWYQDNLHKTWWYKDNRHQSFMLFMVDRFPASVINKIFL